MSIQDLLQDGASAEADKGSVLASISREMVGIYKDQFGRGPTGARTYWCGSDMVSVLLEDTLTLAERNLASMGEHQRLRDTRTFVQYSIVGEFCEPVERLTGRKVKYFFSSTDTEMGGAALECFVLHPLGSEASSRRESPTSRAGGPQPALTSPAPTPGEPTDR